MLKAIKQSAAVSVLFMLLCSASVMGDGINKISPQMPFVYFDLEDIFHQRWVSTYLRGKPVILLTGQTSQRFGIFRWAESFRQEYALSGRAYVLWAVNLRHYGGSRQRLINWWRSVGSPVPVLLDWRGTIGGALKINYEVPNIILIDQYGRFLMHEMATYSHEMYSAVSLKIQNLLNDFAPYSSALSVQSQPKGRKGNSY